MTPGVYLLAATIVEADQLQATRDVVRALLLRGQRKLHWHDENDGWRMLGVKTIATLPALHLVVIRTSTDETSERRRRLCLRRLLCELDAAGVAQVVLECRQRRQDAADRHLLSALRSAKTVRDGLRMQLKEGRSEPLLWLPDLLGRRVRLAGATTGTSTSWPG